VLLTDIYAASEPGIAGISGEALASAISAAGHKQALYCGTMQEGIEWLLREARPGDAVMTVGAGSVGRAADELAILLGAQVEKTNS